MRKILLIGETCEDVFIYGTCDRINPEAPTLIFKPTTYKVNPGMAANVKLNIESLGFECDFITNDKLIKKTRYVDEKSNYILLRTDENDECDPLTTIHSLYPSEYDITIISDYNKGFLTESLISHIAQQSRITFIDTKKQLGGWVKNCDFIKINEKEYNENKEFIDNNLYDKTIVTLGDEGCRFKGVNYPAFKIEVRDVVGAGDTFLAALALKYGTTSDMNLAINFANKCSASVVKKRGVSVPDIEF